MSERVCDRCGGTNPIAWHAPSPLWNAVMRADGMDGYGFCCPSCFIAVAQERGIDGSWHLGVDETDYAGVESADGRVWDPKRCLWIERGSVPADARVEGVGNGIPRAAKAPSTAAVETKEQQP